MSNWTPDQQLSAARAEIERLQKELAEYDRAFVLRYNADQRAIKRWQGEPSKELFWPDHTDLCVWLIGEVERLQAEVHALQTELGTWKSVK